MGSNIKTSEPATFTVTPFTRHSPDYPKKDNPQWKRCNCRKSLYIYEDGKVTYVSAKTRSWEQAERAAQVARDLKDPVKIELAKMEARKAAKDCKLEDAIDQWIAGQKGRGIATQKAYETFKRTTMKWAVSKSIVNLSDVTPDALDAWVATWKDKLGTQGLRVSRVRSFFRWAHGLRKMDENPAPMLRSFKATREDEREQTQPLTAAQFDELIAATYKYDDGRRVDKDRFGVDPRALFLTQRWTGLRISDVLMLPRSSVRGNRIAANMQETGVPFEQVVPVAVTQALAAVPVRKTMHEDQYFWSRQCNHRVLAGMWTPRIRRMNKYVRFKDDRGRPMKFRSHMLRDTFAVELLLAGMSLDKVSKLLGHKSTRVTEKHYAPWVKARKRL